jgi:transcriptional regulator with XRE-family HTH domain
MLTGPALAASYHGAMSPDVTPHRHPHDDDPPRTATGAAELEASLTAVIAQRVREARGRLGLPIGRVSEITGISKGMVSKIENAQVSPSLTTLARLAEALEVPVTSFFRGFDEERDAVFVKAGHGPVLLGQGSAVGHHYEQLGTMRGRLGRMVPLLVTLTERSEIFPLFQHEGTEMLYMLEGSMAYGHGRAVYVLEPGDTLMFDGEASHGPTELIKLPVRFLSITAIGEVR